MVAPYADRAANAQTFLAWISIGLPVVAFGFFLLKLNVPVDAMGGGNGNLSHISAEEGGALITAAARYAGLALVVIGSTIVARGRADLERWR